VLWAGHSNSLFTEVLCQNY